MHPIVLLQAILAVLLIIVILLQTRAAGLTSGTMNTMVVQRRGAEKLLYQGTVVLTIAFCALTVVQWYIG